ncbi:benzoate 1,2-dioxygenase subunit beta [Litchfieldella anticariensis FP35 = DSM 16096]|uniref:Benzoate 1,2-dioxygenase subunit beta n=1 Tax=Litchfieldella anticariensis (strain DSM 16096 / CECT 5854 / CIP 108499 / LMG 22089 / FP35) TaxID=1121939 RepID=S2KI95_LITA3|nr:benzoate 1,2-dioxygenase small subunit [Halomonas anticariensis]EPC01690.1 benzoate 1,2-dioxygenase subunit beta [Halomonas anticariensis FP35 = DSM 16096]
MSMNYLDIQAFVYREARLLDDREWDAWLECYRKDVTFWMPAWDDDDRLTEDPQREISLIYYPSREGLEDRVYRIKTERSGATSIPEPRTTHQISNLEVLSQEGDTVALRFNWHTLSHRYQQTNAYFGMSFYTLDVSGDAPLITYKKVVLNNDYIHQVIDVYHV